MGIFTKKETRAQWEIDMEESVKKEKTDKEESTQKAKNAWKEVILTTTDSVPDKRVVKILGLVQEMHHVNDNLRIAAFNMKGNAVIGIRPASSNLGVYMLLGTAVLLEDI